MSLHDCDSFVTADEVFHSAHHAFLASRKKDLVLLTMFHLVLLRQAMSHHNPQEGQRLYQDHQHQIEEHRGQHFRRRRLPMFQSICNRRSDDSVYQMEYRGRKYNIEVRIKCRLIA